MSVRRRGFPCVFPCCLNYFCGFPEREEDYLDEERDGLGLFNVVATGHEE